MSTFAAVPARQLLLIADIGGYTTFMKLHRVSLVHAGDITRRLLSAVIEACPLPLIEIEGDAAFFAATQDEVPIDAVPLSLEMHRAFHAELARMVSLNMCNCDACLQSRDLKLKFVAHLGNVMTQSIGGHTKVVGVDVITVHRMLKNCVPSPEYLLMTEPLVAHCDDGVRDRVARIEQELEGLGRTSLFHLDLNNSAMPLPPTPKPTLPRRVSETLGVILRCAPAVAGLRRGPRRDAGSRANG